MPARIEARAWIRGRGSFWTRKVISSPAAIITPNSTRIPGIASSGPCQGQRLTPITLVIDDGDVCLTGVQLAEEDGLDIPDPDEMPEVMITGD
jgi:hypothetical protein